MDSNILMKHYQNFVKEVSENIFDLADVYLGLTEKSIELNIDLIAYNKNFYNIKDNSTTLFSDELVEVLLNTPHNFKRLLFPVEFTTTVSLDNKSNRLLILEEIARRRIINKKLNEILDSKRKELTNENVALKLANRKKIRF